MSVLLAMVVIAGLLRRWNDDYSERAWLTWLWIGMALAYCVGALIVFIFGEQKGRARPQPVEVELSLETQWYIDKRLKGIRDT